MTAEADISEFIAGLDENDDIRRLLDLSVGRVLRAAEKRGEEFRPDHRKAAHVADWLRASFVRNETWLANVDDLKRPRKLLKFSRFEDIVKEADKAMRAANARDGVSSSGGGQTLYRDLEHGYRLVQLHTRDALQRESSRMGHCVGNGGYDYVLERKNEAIISLRDRHDKPHATLHISGDAILQMRGKQNKQPKADYITAMMPVISTMRNSSLFFGEFGFLVDTKGIRHQLTELPDGVEVDGSLVIVEGSVTTLPDNMTVHGRLRIENGKLAALPRGLTVKGSLEIDYNRKIRDLPSDLVVEGRLSMRRTRIKKIPAGLKAEALYATGSELEVIPEGFTVQGDLYLSRTRVKALPSGIFVGGVLGIGETKIEALPEDLSCGGIDARESALKAIPPKVVRGGPVDVSHTKLHFIPCDLKAVGRLDVSGTEISSLPFDISQVEQLVLARSGVTALPEELGRKELKFLDISDTSIRKIPSDIIKIGELTARRCNLDTISAGIEIESLNIEGSTTVLPDNLSVRHLRMGEAKIKKLPDGLTVFSSLYATGSDLTEIGQNVRVGTGFFDISKTDVECIPASLKVGIGYCAGIDVSKTRMIALPDLGDVKVDWLSIEKTSIRDVPAGWSIKNIRARGAPLSSVFGKVEKAYGVSRKHAAAFTARGVNVVPWGIRHALLAPYRLGLEIAAVIAIVYASFAPPPENDRPV